VVPFGARVYDAQESEVGLAGQDGRIYLRGIAEVGSLSVRWGDAPDQQCAFRYQLPPERKGDGPFVTLDATCDPAMLTERRDSDKPPLDRIIGQR
jgi:outer membrane usher protein